MNEAKTAESKLRGEETSLTIALQTLSQWRHLPAYQLERRVDIFFALLLPKIIQKQLSLKCEHKDIIPEFPLRKGLICRSESNASYKVDFAVFCQGKRVKKLVLVELKTDISSFDKEQIEHMNEAKEIGTKAVLKGVLDCAARSKERRKYAYLILKLIDEVECLRDPSGFGTLDLKLDRPGLKANFEVLRSNKNLDQLVTKEWSSAEIELLLIFPGNSSEEFLKDTKQFLRGWYKFKIEEVGNLDRDGVLPQLLLNLVECKAGMTNPKPVPKEDC